MKTPRRARLALLSVLSLLSCSLLKAELVIPAIFGDHMVLQRDQPDLIWGWDTPGTTVTVGFSGQRLSAVAAADGKWALRLPPLPATAAGQVLTITGSSERQIRDVVVGEVWLCSGQSNMQFQLGAPEQRGDPNGDLEAAEANLPDVRLIQVPNVGTQTPQTQFKGAWTPSTPATAAKFSAVGFRFGRHLHRILGVPVGLVEAAWGGSAAEAWVPRAALEADPRFARVIASAQEAEAHYREPAAQTEYEAAMVKWKAAAEAAKRAFRLPPYAPPSPEAWLAGNKRPGNAFNGIIHPLLGYGLKGVVWYQGESNTSQAREYAALFPFLIEQWRKAWGEPQLAFYWVQLPGFGPVDAVPTESAWAELREAQTRTLQLPHTGQAVIIDLGEGKDVHPRNKQDVAARLVRWALVKDYGLSFPYRSPEYKSVSVSDGRTRIVFDCFGSRLRPFGTYDLKGFAVRDRDGRWHWAEGKQVADDTVEVWSADVPTPTAVEYAWADNPVCNLYAENGLPVTPFRAEVGAVAK